VSGAETGAERVKNPRRGSGAGVKKNSLERDRAEREAGGRGAKTKM